MKEFKSKPVIQANSTKTIIQSEKEMKMNLMDALLLEKNEIVDDTATTTTFVAILNNVKLIYGGAGMLSIPWTFGKATLIPSIIGVLVACAYACITCIFVLHASDVTQIFEYSELLKRLHPTVEASAAFILIYVTLSTLLSYFILIGDFITEAINGIDPNLRFDNDRRIYISCAFVLLLLPLSLLREFKALKITSMVGILATTYCVVLIIAFACSAYSNDYTHMNVNGTMTKIADGLILSNFNSSILIVTNVVSKACVSHYAIPVMYQQLKDRSVKKMEFVIIFSMVFVAVFYLLFAISGYYLFGSNTQGDIFNNFSNDNIFFIIGRLGYSTSIIANYPIAFKSGLQTIENKFFSTKRGSRYNFEDNKYVRVIVIVSCGCCLWLISLFVEDVGPVSSIEGAVTVLCLIALFPILMTWKIGLVHHTSSHSVTFMAMLGALLLVGFGLGIGGIIMQIKLLGE